MKNRADRSQKTADSNAILESLITSPLLIGDLPEAASFDRSDLHRPPSGTPLDFRQKLGHLYEDALAAIIDHSPPLDLLHRNLQLRESAQKTVGELDFLVRKIDSNALIHLELALKFYLVVETKNGPIFPGPDASDNYPRKLARLRDHQLTLLKKYRHLLPELSGDSPNQRAQIKCSRAACSPLQCPSPHISSQHLIYGCLFHHIAAITPYLPPFAAKNGRRGLWLHRHECDQYFTVDHDPRIVPKRLWPVDLTSLDCQNLDPWQPDPSPDRCVMVHLRGHPLPHFIAPDDYPCSASMNARSHSASARPVR